MASLSRRDFLGSSVQSMNSQKQTNKKYIKHLKNGFLEPFKAIRKDIAALYMLAVALLWAFTNTIIKFFQFNLTSAGALVIQSIFGPLGVRLVGTQYDFLVLAFVVAFMVLPYNYFMYNKVIWKTGKKKE